MSEPNEKVQVCPSSLFGMPCFKEDDNHEEHIGYLQSTSGRRMRVTWAITKEEPKAPRGKKVAIGGAVEAHLAPKAV